MHRTIREKFGLTFYRMKNPETGEIDNGCERKEVNEYSVLQFISDLETDNCQHLIDVLQDALDGQPYQDFVSSGPYEDVEIELSYPNVTIAEELTISMSDFKGLLEEWKEFISKRSYFRFWGALSKLSAILKR